MTEAINNFLTIYAYSIKYGKGKVHGFCAFPLNFILDENQLSRQAPD